MRRIGNLTDPKLAKRFCDYLITLSIDATADPRVEDPAADAVAKSWDIWIRDEKDVDQARDELARFEQNPNDERFQASAEAGRIREEKAAEHARRLKNQVKRPQWSDQRCVEQRVGGRGRPTARNSGHDRDHCYFLDLQFFNELWSTQCVKRSRLRHANARTKVVQRIVLCGSPRVPEEWR